MTAGDSPAVMSAAYWRAVFLLFIAHLEPLEGPGRGCQRLPFLAMHGDWTRCH
jgi:hypothetical protein